jgi:hypothetical protein
MKRLATDDDVGTDPVIAVGVYEGELPEMPSLPVDVVTKYAQEIRCDDIEETGSASEVLEHMAMIHERIGEYDPPIMYNNNKMVGEKNHWTYVMDTTTRKIETMFMTASLQSVRVFATPDFRHIIASEVDLTEEDLREEKLTLKHGLAHVFSISGKLESLITGTGASLYLFVCPDNKHLVTGPYGYDYRPTVQLIEIDAFVQPGEKEMSKMPWIEIPVPTGFIHTVLSLDKSRMGFVYEDSRLVPVVDLNTYKMCPSLTVPHDISMDDICMDPTGKQIVTKLRAYEEYERVCAQSARVLLQSQECKFADRMKLSVWLMPDVFADAVVCPHFDMTRTKALQIIGREIMQAGGMGDALKNYCKI